MSAAIRRVFILLCWAVSCSGVAQTEALDVASLGREAVPLTRYFAWLDDPDRALALADVQKPEMTSRFGSQHASDIMVRFPASGAHRWLRLTLRNSSNQPVSTMMELAAARLAAEVEYYQPLLDGTVRTVSTGYLRPYTQRPYPNHFYVFPITVPAQAEQTIYLRLQSPISINFRPRLWTLEAFERHELRDYGAQSVYFGMVLAMSAFNLLLFFALRETNYLLYVIFVLLTAFTVASNNGIAIEQFFPESPVLGNASLLISASLTLIALTFFMRRMVNTPALTPRVDRLLLAVAGVHLLLPAGLLIDYAAFLRPSIAISGITVALVMATAAYCVHLKSRSAIFFLIAFAALGLASMEASLWGLGITGPNPLTVNGLQIGSAIEMVVLAIALADRFNEERKARAKAQQAALLAQQDALIAHNESMLAQTQLAQSEKMAALGQLIASVTHEINTPIGAVKSSGRTILDALDHALANLPRLFRVLGAAESALFLKLIHRVRDSAAMLSSREERTLIRQATKELDAHGIAHAQQHATLLVQLNAHTAIADFLPLLKHPEVALILTTARNLSCISQSAENINAAIDRAGKIVLALKSFSHFSASGEMIEAHLRDSVETVLTIYQGQIRQGTDVVRRFEDIPPIRCLPDELTQVWTNLIHNALQAMEHGGTLTIAIRREDDDAIVSITDTGCGIPEEIRDRIFDVFFTTKPAGIGSGLGLDIVRKIVDKHQGRIDLQSEVGVGTTFEVRLPYR